MRKVTKKKVIPGDRTPLYETTVETVQGGVDSSRLPVDPATRRPIAPMAQPGYYPGYATLSQQAFWDEATRNVVLERVNNPPSLRFFTPEETVLMKAVADRLLPQDDRDDDHKIPVVNYIDERLYKNQLNGYRYEDMPPDRDAYKLGLQATDAIAKHMYTIPFIELGPREQDSVLLTIQQGEPPAGQEIWQKMSVHRFWTFILNDLVEAYYRHPYAWDEIGFGGPAYPRGYMRLEGGKPEYWEVQEQRYEWEAPITALSGEYRTPTSPEAEKQQTTGQPGTH